MKRLTSAVLTLGALAAAGLAFTIASSTPASAQTTPPAGCVSVLVPKKSSGRALISVSGAATRVGAIFRNQGPANLSISGGIGLNAGEQRAVVFTSSGPITATNYNATADATVLVCNPF
jgi:hypothetical protein